MANNINSGVNPKGPELTAGRNVANSTPSSSPSEKVGNVAVDGFSQIAGRYNVNGLNAQEYLRIPPEDAKHFSIWCAYEAEPSKTIELLKTILSEEPPVAEDGTKGQKKLSEEELQQRAAEERFKRVFAKAMQLASSSSEQKYSWCKVSASQPSTWYGSGDQQLNPPALNLTKGLMSSLTRFTPISFTETPDFCEQHNSWVETIQSVVPQTVQSMIISEWEASGGREWPKDGDQYKKFNAAMQSCLHAFDIAKIGANTYDISTDPKKLCLSAMELVANKKDDVVPEVGEPTNWYSGGVADINLSPKQELAQYLDMYMLKMPWISWVQRYTFCEDMYNKSAISKLGSAILRSTITWLAGGYVALSAVVMAIARSLGSSLTLLGAAKLIPQVHQWAKRWKGLKEIRAKKHAEKAGKDNNSKPKGPTGGAPAAEGAKETAKAQDPKPAAKPVEFSLPALEPRTVATAATLGAMVYGAYKVLRPALVIGATRFVSPAAALVPANEKTVEELGHAVDCGIRGQDTNDCTGYKLEQKRAFKHNML